MADGDVYTGDAAEATSPVYTMRSLRANLRAAIASVRATGLPAIIAERGARPVAVLVDYARWAAQQGQSGADVTLAEGAARGAAPPQPRSQRETRPHAEPAQAAQPAAAIGTTGWGSPSAPRGPATGAAGPIPAGWRADKSGWGG